MKLIKNYARMKLIIWVEWLNPVAFFVWTQLLVLFY